MTPLNPTRAGLAWFLVALHRGARVAKACSRLGVSALVMGGCQGQSDEPKLRLAPRSLGPPPEAVAPSAFRPFVPLGVDTGGRCREDPYMTGRGFRAVTWRRDDDAGRWWSIDVAIDSTGAVRRYAEDRYAGSAGRTMIHVDFQAGWAEAENSIPGEPAQTTSGDATAFFHAPNLDNPSAQAARVLGRCRVSLDPWGVLAGLPDSLRPPPQPRRAPRSPGFDRVFPRHEAGAGYLMGGAELKWLRMVILPLYAAPGGEVEGWLARGWVVRPMTPAPTWKKLTAAGWRGVGGESIALTVLDLHDDGWFRLRYAAPDGSTDGTAWAHVSHLNLGDVDLRLVGWEEHFLRVEGTVFRAPGMHYLREGASAESIVLDSLTSFDRWGGRSEESYALTPLEMKGDWMRARVQRPKGFCGDQPGPQTTMEGWVRWRDSVNGLMLATGSPIC